MTVSEEMMGIIEAAVKWVFEKATPTKRQLKIKVADLEKEVARLSEGKAFLESIHQMTQAAISQLKDNPRYIVEINVDSIVITGVNEGTVTSERINTENSNNLSVGSQIKCKVKSDDDDDSFFVTDEDLIRARIKKK